MRSGPREAFAVEIFGRRQPVELPAAATSFTPCARWQVRVRRWRAARSSSFASIAGEQLSGACAATWQFTRPLARAVPLLNQRFGARQEGLPEGLVDRVVAEPDLARVDVGAAFGEPQPHAGVRHRARVGADMAERIDQGRGAAADRLQAAERRHDGALVVAHRVGDRRHVAVDDLAVPVLDRAAQRGQHRVGMRIDEARQHREAAPGHPLEVRISLLQVRALADGGDPIVRDGDRTAIDDPPIGVAGDDRRVGDEQVHEGAPKAGSGSPRLPTSSAISLPARPTDAHPSIRHHSPT